MKSEEYKRNCDKYAEEAVNYILDTLLEHKWATENAVAEYIRNKYPHMADYQIKEIVCKAIYKIGEIVREAIDQYDE